MKTLLFLVFCNSFYKCICNDKGEDKQLSRRELLDKAYSANEFKLDQKPVTTRTKRLTCISCNNVDTRACSNPEQQTFPTETCPDLKDVCLSMHTPFGIVKRSCYNPNRKQILYFCSCDMCNDTPMNLIGSKQFTDKKKWIDNVAEISHARRLRFTIQARLKCLKCEVKGPEDEESNSKLYKACLLGDFQPMEIQYCTIDEVCGLRVVKSRGAVMRGCVGGPLYNYLYTFCDSDNCNVEPVVSVYDPLDE